MILNLIFITIVLISNDSTFEDYYRAVKDIVNIHYEHGYPVDIIQNFKIRVWNIDSIDNKDIKLTSTAINNKNKDVLNKSISSSTSGYDKINILPSLKRYYHSNSVSTGEFKNNIKPLKNGILNKEICEDISTMDIETISFNGKQIPICITVCYNFTKSKLFLIDNDLLLTDLNTALNKLWNDFFNFITSTNKDYFKNIFVHNLGSFDGYFLFYIKL